MIKYIRPIEELTNCPVALVSTSSEREDTILVRDPFVDGNDDAAVLSRGVV